MSSVVQPSTSNSRTRFRWFFRRILRPRMTLRIRQMGIPRNLQARRPLSRNRQMATPWKVPKNLWRNRIVAILASGPSLLECLPALQARAGDVVAVAVNSTGVSTKDDYGRLRPAACDWADMLYAADSCWWRLYCEQALKFPGLKVTASSDVPWADVLYLRPTGPEGFDPLPGTIRTGGNSAYQAMHIAAQAGARKIILCGVDMHTKNGVHHHGHHPSPLRNPGEAELTHMARRFTTFPFKDLGIEIVNCSKTSILQCFPKVDIEEALS